MTTPENDFLVTTSTLFENPVNPAALLRTVPPITDIFLADVKTMGKMQILARVIGIQKVKCG